MSGDGEELLPVVVTPRLRLRCWRPSDAAALSANMTPKVSRWLSSWPDPTPPELARQRIVEARAGVSEGWHVSYAIERLSDDLVIGGFGGGAKDQRLRVEIGYHLAEGAHGQGYMMEAAQAGLSAVWSQLPAAETIEAQAHPDNAASRAILSKLGMRFVGERPVFASARGVWEPGCWYELARPD
ncbi:N-acetyltransferase [Caulobacter vibrioides]|uniref:N-acetyltransferase n=1 Tax=Caulobacter vibrioides TaxID=155892 RepID=A0A290MHU4_CAUVI|nr:GNAT family protein [Caulobacter vibrioides]ATC31578.1 N-acetyltransferase [Caulobacter vibrioides]